MRNEGSKIRHCKRRGEWAELRFMARAAEHGLCVSKPWGECAQYDFAVEYEAGFVRVQVKSTECRRGNSFPCKVSPGSGLYAGDPFDFVAAYVIPEDLWYLIPAEKTMGHRSVLLSPGLKAAKYGPYKEAWELLQVGVRVKRLKGCVELFEVCD